MYLIDLSEQDKVKVNLAKQKFLKQNPEKAKAGHVDIVNAALDLYLKE